jgi:hypothetical protein
MLYLSIGTFRRAALSGHVWNNLSLLASHLTADRGAPHRKRSSIVEDFLGLLALEILLSVSAALALLLASGAGG